MILQNVLDIILNCINLHLLRALRFPLKIHHYFCGKINKSLSIPEHSIYIYRTTIWVQKNLNHPRFENKMSFNMFKT